MVKNTEIHRERLERQRSQLEAELAESPPKPADGMGYSTHQADHGTDAFEQAAGEAVRRNTERLLYEVERALTRIDEGRYGICRRCGGEIDNARLKAIPYARYCLRCADRGG